MYVCMWGRGGGGGGKRSSSIGLSLNAYMAPEGHRRASHDAESPHATPLFEKFSHDGLIGPRNSYCR